MTHLNLFLMSAEPASIRTCSSMAVKL